ncbi:alanine--glyoxylate aminotransferase 2, mitochondrial [Microplitis demolitor]|uniref:alanine--glyoxylate aminotransferase 2, mitochondrial n=1 Tax=Microplitis demolitor TaxID=69319 RepID=UPI0004CCB0CB|nr:alanine--glyoxylate aminotransferase 2, mitochondrial [Microplitis demolitor]
MSRGLINWSQLRRYSSMPELPSCKYSTPFYQGADYETVKATRLAPSERPYYKKPLLIHEGHGQWLWDHTGRRYLDMFAGIVTVGVGHSHPKITEALSQQISKLGNTTVIYMHPQYHEYVDKLKKKLPENLNVIYLVNSGSEANELAFLLAKLYTGAQEIISLQNGYHGGTAATQAASGLSIAKYPVAQTPGFTHVMNPDVYKGPWGCSHCRDCPVSNRKSCSCVGNNCQAADKYFGQLQNIFKYCLPSSKPIAAFIAESIQGIGGIVQYPKTYLSKVFDLVRSKGGICIADEVQAGFGRTGDHFWGFQGHGVMPDVITMAKAIGNGFPLGAVVTTKEIAEVLNKAMRVNTFGGNPLACAVGSAVLDIIDEEQLQENCKIVGTHLLHRLSTLMLDYPTIIGDVRGKGLMIGIELVGGVETKEPLPVEQVLDIFEDIKDMGVLIGKGGVNGNVLRVKPPMCITKEDADFTVEIIKKALDNHRDKYINDKESVFFGGV